MHRFPNAAAIRPAPRAQPARIGKVDRAACAAACPSAARTGEQIHG